MGWSMQVLIVSILFFGKRLVCHLLKSLFQRDMAFHFNIMITLNILSLHVLTLFIMSAVNLRVNCSNDNQDLNFILLEILCTDCI